MDEPHPVEVLKALRDHGEKSRDWSGLCRLFKIDPDARVTGNIGLRTVLDRLRGGGFIEFTVDPDTNRIEGDIRMSRLWDEIGGTLKVSLSGLSELTVPGAMVVRPSFGPARRVKDQCDIFIIMPFKGFDNVFAAVQRAASQLRLTAKRGDGFITNNSVMEDVWGAIVHSSLVIAVCTEENPNVYYELAIAHTVGKATIILSSHKEDVPFNINYRRFIRYHNSTRGMEILANELEAAIPNLIGQGDPLSDLR